MTGIMIFIFSLPGLALIGWMVSSVVQYSGRMWDRKRLCSLPSKVEYGFLSIDKIHYTTHLTDAYTVDSKGNSYTHIGAGGKIRLPQSYTLCFIPGGDLLRPEKSITLHSLPGEKNPRNITCGYCSVVYVTDSYGMHYFLRSAPVGKGRL